MRHMETLEFIEATDIVPREWDGWFWAEMSCNAPFTWGDNCHSLVTLDRFLDHAETLGHDDLIKPWADKLKKELERDILVDLET